MNDLLPSVIEVLWITGSVLLLLVRERLLCIRNQNTIQYKWAQLMPIVSEM